MRVEANSILARCEFFVERTNFSGGEAGDFFNQLGRHFFLEHGFGDLAGFFQSAFRGNFLIGARLFNIREKRRHHLQNLLSCNSGEFSHQQSDEQIDDSFLLRDAANVLGQLLGYLFDGR